MNRRHRVKHRIYLLLTGITLLSVPGSINAQTWALAFKPGTLGVGAEVIRSFGPYVNVRVGGAALNVDYKDENSNEYVLDADIRVAGVSALVDWYPQGGVFHLTGGIMMKLNSVKALLTPKKSYDIGGRIYTPEMLGSLTADVDFTSAAPYLGFGFGNAHGSDSGFTFDMGVIYHGPPSVVLTADGLLEPSTEQAPRIEDNLDWFKLYPYVSIGYLLAL